MAISAPSSYSKYAKYFRRSSLTPNATHQAYLEIVLSFAALIFFGWFALRPTLTTIGELIGEIEFRKDVVSRLDQKIDALAAARATYEAAAPQLILLEESLPADLQISQFTAQIEILGLESGLEIANLTFDPFALDKDNPLAPRTGPVRQPPVADPASPAPAAPVWKSLEFDLIAVGNYPQIRQFVSQLHGLRRVVILDTLVVKTAATTEEENLTLQLTGRVTYL